jgi:membrane protein implicated in regulation of membrane protease activity
VGEDDHMGLLILILLILAAVTGVLWSVLEIALGVALGIFFGGVLLAVVAFYLTRRAVRGPRSRSWGGRNRY